MRVEFNGAFYELLLGSIQNEGSYLEMNDVSGSPLETVLSVFCADPDGQMTFSAYRQDLPFGAVEWFMAEARRQLPRSGEKATEDRTVP